MRGHGKMCVKKGVCCTLPVLKSLQACIFEWFPALHWEWFDCVFVIMPGEMQMEPCSGAAKEKMNGSGGYMSGRLLLKHFLISQSLSHI